MDTFHTPVLLQEVIDGLKLERGKKYIDATVGGGGHTGAILQCGGKVLGIDVDEDALTHVREKYSEDDDLILAKGNFTNIAAIAHSHSFGPVAGIVFDLGVSSHQLESEDRGFSFQKQGQLDMRMDQSLSVRAADLINALTKGELYELFTTLGEERRARAISDGIVRARGAGPIETTEALVHIVRQASPGGFSKIHPATRVFQALRIAVNDELHSIQNALPQSLGLLESKGRIAVISFHSLEDRIVKNTFKELQKEGKGNIITKKPIVPGEEEIIQNRRSRSAKLRIFEKT